MLFDNYVTQVDADAKSDLPVVGELPLAASHPPLHLCGTTHRIDDACELGKQDPAGGDQAFGIFGGHLDNAILSDRNAEAR